MVSKAAAIPVGTLVGLAVVMFIFIWWWFPRHYQKGIHKDMINADLERREMDEAVEQLRQQRQQETGEVKAPEQAHLAGEPTQKTADERLWELVAVHRQVLKNRAEQGRTPAAGP